MKQLTIKSALLLCAVLFAFSACNREKFTLVYNLNEGDTFEIFMSADMNLRQVMMGQLIEMGIYTQMTTSYTVSSVTDNTIGLDFVFDEVVIGMDADEFAFEFSSHSDAVFATEEDLGPILKAMTNLPFSMTMNKQGEVQSVRGFDQIMDAMLASIDGEVDAFTREQMVSQFAQQFNEEAMQSNLGQWFAVFPSNPVRIGESWNTTQAINTGQVNMHIDMKTTLRSVSGNVAVLEQNATFATDEPIVQITGGMETAISLTGTQTGTLEIDMNTGWIIRGELTQDIETKLDMFGMILPQTITSRINFEGR